MFTKNFKELSKKNTDIAGGKGASLGEMTTVGIPVPSGFVVLAGSFDRFLEETDLGVEIEAILKEVNTDDINSVEKASEKIRDLIRDAEFPKDIAEEIMGEYKKLFCSQCHSRGGGNPEYLNNLDSPRRGGRGNDMERSVKNNFFVAVRSSATAEDSSIASWAGELESYLNVNEKNLLESVKKCWSSLFTPRAIFYRYEKKLHDSKVSVAVVVQKMIQSEVSGICFTVHPVTEDRNQMVIEAGYGLGEAIVGGMITPDTYIVDKSKAKPSDIRRLSLDAILDKNISEQSMMIVREKNGTKEVDVPDSEKEKQKLSDKDILKLADLCCEIENHYKKPQDIEWAMENGEIYIVQSRPITTL